MRNAFSLRNHKMAAGVVSKKLGHVTIRMGCGRLAWNYSGYPLDLRVPGTLGFLREPILDQVTPKNLIEKEE